MNRESKLRDYLYSFNLFHIMYLTLLLLLSHGRRFDLFLVRNVLCHILVYQESWDEKVAYISLGE